MIPFLAPKYIKQAKLYVKGAEKKIAYNRDLWSEETLNVFTESLNRLKVGIKARDKVTVEASEKELDDLCRSHCPALSSPGMSENVEVFLVAIVIALGIRTYFLQPFTIPTASMFPTLNGITGKRTAEEPPNIITQGVEFAAKGRRYVNVVAKDDERIKEVTETTRYAFFTYTKVVSDKGNVYWIPENKQAVGAVLFPAPEGFNRHFKKGEPIARGYFDTGDHVFVDKVSYHFRKPTRSEVFVFTTANIPGIETRYTQYYIKRLAGTPGDELRIDAPSLFINGELAKEPALQKVMSGKYPNPEGYQGYSNQIGGHWIHPNDVFKIGPTNYFALGDNSYNSSDSRVWGQVPQRDLVGPGVFVYWPFMRDTGTHFGLIK